MLNIRMKTINQREHPREIGFNMKELPEAQDWKNGETYTLAIEVEQVADYIHPFENVPVKNFKIKKVGAVLPHDERTIEDIKQEIVDAHNKS